MTPISLRVNGRQVAAMIEPRMHLADFLREHCRLTGTHLGCEHGVCGACTVLINGEPARSCIAFVVACEGQEVRTIEGFEDDPPMQRLREAFTREHALQCGFCTPGMLIASRDIVQRLPGADEERIRIELSGNLCRCTGYLGIVKAVRSVAQSEAMTPRAQVAEKKAVAAAPLRAFEAKPVEAQAPPLESAAPSLGETLARQGWTRFEESFVIRKSPVEVWRIFADLPLVAACLPGAVLTEHDASSAKGTMTVKLGPITAAFSGSAAIERDDAGMRGTIRGAGNDRGTGSRTRGDVYYRLVAEDGGATRVFITVEYTLAGTLAQFSRTSLAQDLGRRLVAEFAESLNSRLATAQASSAPTSAPLDAGSLLWQWLRARLRRLLGR